jgi:sugar (pentulose or hexulose) kinase
VSAGHPLGLEVGWHVIPGHFALLGGSSLGLTLLPVLEQLGVESRGGQTSLDAGALALVDAAGPLEAPVGPVSTLRERIDAAQMVMAHHDEGPEHIWLSVMRTAVAGSHQLLLGLEKLAGPVSEVRVTGGWSRNPLLRELKSRVFPPLTYPVVRESGIRGAGLLAALAAGVVDDVARLPAPQIDDRVLAADPTDHQ